MIIENEAEKVSNRRIELLSKKFAKGLSPLEEAELQTLTERMRVLSPRVSQVDMEFLKHIQRELKMP